MKNLIFKKLLYDINIFFFVTIISIASIIWIIQAVNFLDIISEDGHGIKVYFLYTIFSLPKIISKILPFIYFITLTQIITQYEKANTLMIYWINGITKMKFSNIIISISFIYFLLQLFMSTLVVPYSLDKGRSFFRSSNINLFSAIIKEKQFVDVIENLTIFSDKKNNNFLENIIIKEKINDIESQIIVAKNGEFIEQGNNKSILLKNGKIITTSANNQNIIDFENFNLNLNKFNTNTITTPKIQEMNSKNLVKCLFFLSNQIKENENFFFPGCTLQIKDAVFAEILKRFCLPFSIIIIGALSSMLIVLNKNDELYKRQNIFIFIITIVTIFITELFIDFSTANLIRMIIYPLTLILLFIIIYFFQYYKLKKETN